ncbi:hypothetical protein [Ekhidna sp.]|uniref:hypothetical protein n=1 Tax=Ekhidna sp. TaxID=2608089 RepID=UPI003B504C59
MKNLLLIGLLVYTLNGYSQWDTTGANIHFNGGNVGIGTTSPSEALEVIGKIKADYLKLDALSGSEGGELQLAGPSGYNAWMVDNRLGHFRLHHSGKLYFQVNSNGHVGVGTATPASKLHVSSLTNGDAVLRIESDTDNSNEADNARIELLQDGGSLGAYIGFSQEWNGGSGTPGQQADNLFRIGSRYSNVDYYDRLVINTNNGNIGIGTSTPVAKLDVKTPSGSIRIAELGSASAKISSTAALGLEATSGSFIQFLASGNEIGRFTSDGKFSIDNANPKTILSIGNHSNKTLSTTGITLGSNHKSIELLHSGSVNGYGSKLYGVDEGNGITSLRFAVRGNSTTWTDAIYVKASNNSSVGNVGIGTTTPSHKLEVNGTIRSQEVKVEATNWPDYVFEPDYNLRTLEETEAYIQSNKHLPEIPSAKEMEANGVQLGEMNMLLLKKIEELTLHTIEQEKRLSAQQKEIDRLKNSPRQPQAATPLFEKRGEETEGRRVEFEKDAKYSELEKQLATYQKNQNEMMEIITSLKKEIEALKTTNDHE